VARLDGRELYEHQKAAGMLYRAALGPSSPPRSESPGRRSTRTAIAEIQGVPEVLVETWSTRRHEVSP